MADLRTFVAKREIDYMYNTTDAPYTTKQKREVPRRKSDITYIAKTLYGLEDVLAKELEILGASNIEIGRRMVRFSGDQRLLYLANYRLRTALRILKPIYEFKCDSIEHLYETLRYFAWDKYIRRDQTFLIDPVVYSDRFSNSRYVSYRVKDAIADYFVENDPEGKRPPVKMDSPDVRFNVHIAQRQVTLSLDSSGDSLHKRGYKVKQTPAPLSEILAAGILLKAGWHGQCDLLDPMCGSGTFSIEAALIARGIAAGTWRTRYAFEEWTDFDPQLWKEIREDTGYEIPFEHHIYASDIANDAYTVTSANVQHTGLGHDISVEHLAMQRLTPPEAPVLMVLNPPYGERLNKYDLEALYSMIGTELKHKYAGSKVWIIAPKSKLFHAIGLRPSSKQDLLNGDLECELRSFELFEGKRDDYKRENSSGKGRSHPTSRPYRAKENPREGKFYDRDRGEKGSYTERRERGNFGSDRKREECPNKDKFGANREQEGRPRRRIHEREAISTPRREMRLKPKSSIQVFDDNDQ